MIFYFNKHVLLANRLKISVDEGEIYEIKRENYKGQSIAILNLRSYSCALDRALEDAFDANEIQFYKMCAELNKSGESFKIVKKHLEERLIKLKKEVKTIVDLIDN